MGTGGFHRADYFLTLLLVRRRGGGKGHRGNISFCRENSPTPLTTVQRWIMTPLTCWWSLCRMRWRIPSARVMIIVVLQATEITDPNRNRVQVAFDALGMVVGTAVRGKTLISLGILWTVSSRTLIKRSTMRSTMHSTPIHLLRYCCKMPEPASFMTFIAFIVRGRRIRRT